MEFLLLPSFLFFVLLCFNEPLSSSSISFTQPQCTVHDRLALLQFKQSFRINCSVSNSPHPYPKMRSWIVQTNVSCCSWDGVTCDQKTGHVTGLNLSSSCLYGPFPSNSSLFGLIHLKELNLAYNYFNGSQIPSKLGDFQRLESLNLSFSAFTGQIPPEIATLTDLYLLDLSWNTASSDSGQLFLKFKDPSLDKLLQNLTHLKHLHLDSVEINSTVPTILTNLTTLETLSITFSKLRGQFPASIFSLPRLELLYLSGNEDLEGSLPEFQLNSPLKKLALTFTSFSGQVPSSIGKLVHLEILSLLKCRFSGPIPSSLGDLTKLTLLNLKGNFFSGGIPSSISNLTQLQNLGLSNLKARPEMLFSWLAKLTNLSDLSLTDMNLNGEIPAVLGNLTALESLDLSKNRLIGRIPNWLMNLTRLESLALQDNLLTGPIPAEISQLRKLTDVSLGYNSLHGNFHAFLKLKYLNRLWLAGINLKFPPMILANASVPKLTSLDLSSCNLTTFPPFLQSQTKLQDLTLSYNKIQGVIPQWFINLTRKSLYLFDASHNFLTGFEQSVVTLPWRLLVILYLQDNQLKGSLPIPSQFMSIYQISQNHLTGIIPQQLCQAESLSYLDISNNKLDGRIPECISELTGSLSVMNFRGNNFQGTIPQAYANSCALRMINLSQNRLEGYLPRSLINCNNLEVIDIGTNKVKDVFPSWLGSLPNLQILVLQQNSFHGSIGKPNSNADFRSLRIIDLSQNLLTGEIPYHYLKIWGAMKIAEEHQPGESGTDIYLVVIVPNQTFLLTEAYEYSITITNKGNDLLYSKILTVFCVIDFSSNNFTGKIPSSIGELKGLQALNLSNNNLHGGIPSSFANMKNLESLDLSNNLLTGEIPLKLTQLTFLEVFNVSHNTLVGSIPQGSQFSTFDNSSFYGNRGLCGHPLSKKCENADKALLPMKTIDEEDNSHLIDWLIRSLGCICGLVVGYVIGKYITDQKHEWFVETFGKKRS